MEWLKILGKKVVALRGYRNKGKTPLSYILFDDNETYIELTEQSPYDYHDCSTSARNLDLHKDKVFWKKLMDKEDGFGEASMVEF